MSLNRCAELIARELSATGARYVPAGNWGWFNMCLTGPFARAHLERIVRNKVDILHCVVMPHTNDPAPIFGFDVIALNDQLTGLFLDLTPTAEPAPWPITPEVKGEPRPLPDWATFFSPQFISCVPTRDDVWSGLTVLREHLRMINQFADGDRRLISCAQQLYTERQRANPKTYRMLQSIVGPEKADEFIRTVLWPDVITGGHHANPK